MMAILAEWLPASMFENEAIRVVLVLLLFSAIFGIAEGWYLLLHPPEEWTRKFVHIGCGIVTASFHWIFSSNWPVIIIGIVTAAFIAFARTQRLLRSVFGVQRHSYGDLYYLIAATLLFIISHDHQIFYFISMLTLTISDALAAILGTTYQRMTYSVENHYKSIEGSVVFFLSTFLIVHLPLLLLTDIDRLHCVLIAIQVSLLVTYLEGVSLNGIDNILVPFGTYYLLLTFTEVDSYTITTLLLIQLIILIAGTLTAWKLPFFTMSGSMTVQLFLFWALIIGGTQWLIAPLIALCIFIACLKFFYHHHQPGNFKIYQVVAVFYVTLIPGLLILANDIFTPDEQAKISFGNTEGIYALYVGIMSGQLAVALFRLSCFYSSRQDQGWKSMLLLTFCSGILIIPPALLTQTGLQGVVIYSIAAALLIPFLYYHLRKIIESNTFPWEFRIQALSSFLATLIIIPFYLMLAYR